MLNESVPEEVVDQFTANDNFPPALIKYIEKATLENISGDSFILLVNVFNDNVTLSESFA